MENDAVVFKWEQRNIENITIHLLNVFPLLEQAVLFQLLTLTPWDLMWISPSTRAVVSTVLLFILLLYSKLLDTLWRLCVKQDQPSLNNWAPSFLPHWSWSCYEYITLCSPWLGSGVCWPAQSWLRCLSSTWIVCIWIFRSPSEEQMLGDITTSTRHLWHDLALTWPLCCCTTSVFVASRAFYLGLDRLNGHQTKHSMTRAAWCLSWLMNGWCP